MNSEYEKFEGYIPGNDNLRWGQSYYYNFYGPKTRIGAFVRLGLLENQKETNNWFVVFKDGLPLFNRNNLNLFSCRSTSNLQHARSGNADRNHH